MLSTLITLFIALLAGLAIIGKISDRQSANNPKITPGLNLLPGDVSWQNKSGSVKVYFPVVSSIVLSVVITLIMWLFQR